MRNNEPITPESIARAAMENAKRAAMKSLRQAMEEFPFLRVYRFDVVIDAKMKDGDGE